MDSEAEKQIELKFTSVNINFVYITETCLKVYYCGVAVDEDAALQL